MPLSAALNSFATFGGIPIFFAKPGSCAAAAMVRACAGDLLGIEDSLCVDAFDDVEVEDGLFRGGAAGGKECHFETSGADVSDKDVV